MLHPSFELALDEDRLFHWADLTPKLASNSISTGKAFNHRCYPILRVDCRGVREIVWMRQGLIPAYAQDEDGAEEREEAHAESLTCSSCYRSAFRRRRCIIPADRVTEVQHGPERNRVGCSMALSSGEVFGLAGVWETWENDNGHSLETFAVVTTPAGSDLYRVADRVPVVIGKTDQERWLYTGVAVQQPLDLLRPLNTQELREWRLSPCLST